MHSIKRRFLRFSCLSLALALPAAQAGEIIIGKRGAPAQERTAPATPADALTLPGGQSSGVSPPVNNPASEMRSRAHSYLDDDEEAAPVPLIKNSPPINNAEKMRQTARNWLPPAPAASKDGRDNRCRTENTIGDIEGASAGHHNVNQSPNTDVSSFCK